MRSRAPEVLGLALCSLLAAPARAQAPASEPPDTARASPLDAVVVTAARSAAPLATSAAAVSRLTAEELQHLPLRTVADALALVPGLAFVDFNGSGHDPQLTVRGFYGGGEAEYVVVLLNGTPLNRLETGRVNWNLIPLSTVETIEVLRGSASALYGDAAVGAVINIITRPPSDGRSAFTLVGGQHGELLGAAELTRRIAGRAVSGFGRLHRSDGFRDHAGRRAATLGGSLALVEDAHRSLMLSVLNDWRSLEDPGPLTGADLLLSRAQAAPFYRFDHTRERLHRLALHGTATLGEHTRATGYLAGELDRADGPRTLRLAPDFADTRVRSVRGSRLVGSAQLERRHARPAWEGRLTVGTDLSIGRLATAYFDHLAGDSTAYRTAPGERGDAVARGDGTRTAAAGFVHYELRPLGAVRLSVGGRLDWLRDAYQPRAPSEGARTQATHAAFSPKAGINVQYLRSAGQTGHAYVNIGRAFKAATPNQLFDPRPIPIPVEPYAVTISNALLDPQHGTSVEAGFYHRAERLPGSLTGQLSLTGYHLDMRDELDLDLQRFRYVNLARSRHRGIEAGLQLQASSGARAFVNYTVQAVTSRFGENSGRYLKAIPRHALSGGVSAALPAGLAASATATGAWGVYLDDANTIGLPGHARVDLRLSRQVRAYRLSLEVHNLLNRQYSSTGFPDPGGSDVRYYFPAAGRTVRVGLSGGQ